MALIVLTSASGSPGVTTAALGLALTWHRPVLLIEADPTGGSALLAGYFRGQTSPTQTLIDLAFAHRAGALAEAIPSVSMQIPDTTVRMIAGTQSHGQARSLTSLWEPLAAHLKQLDTAGQDVIVDAGRLGLTGAPEPLANCADLCLLVTRTDLVALSGAHSWADTLRGGFEQQGAGSSVALLTVGEGRPYRAREIAKVLQLPVLASLAWDVEAAAVVSHGAERCCAGAEPGPTGRGGVAQAGGCLGGTDPPVVQSQDQATWNHDDARAPGVGDHADIAGLDA